MTEKKVKEDSKSAKSKMQTFEVGDLAVYPAHGVGQIQSIESRIVNGEEHKFYIMKVIENYTRESGVRSLERLIGKVVRYVAKSVAMEESYQKRITPALIKEIEIKD